MSKRKKKPYTPYSKAEDNFLRENLHLSYHELERQMGRSRFGIISRIRTLGLVVPEEVIKERVEKSRFKKGSVPPNKGIKGWYAPGCEKGWFKKGGDPPNTLYDGAITIRHNHKDRLSRPYKYIRISEAKWIPYHQYLWRKHFGEIPSKHIVVFKDGDTMNCVIENLELITMQENLNRNRNYEKGVKTFINSPKRIAFLISRDNKEVRKHILKNCPDLIELKKQQLKLKREIKNANTRRIKKQTMDV